MEAMPLGSKTIVKPARGSSAGGQKIRQVWTLEEDRVLSKAIATETPANGSISWHKVAAHLPGRNNKDCRKRWHYSVAHTIRKGTWTKEEDDKLLRAVDRYGARWSKVAAVVGSRNGDQCWKRWYDCLDPRIDKSPWTAQEDAKLLHEVAQNGRSWSEIVNKHFPNRTSLSAKNRYSILQRRREAVSSSATTTSTNSANRNSTTETPRIVLSGPPQDLDSDMAPEMLFPTNVMPTEPISRPQTGTGQGSLSGFAEQSQIDDFFQQQPQQRQQQSPADGWYPDGSLSEVSTPGLVPDADHDWETWSRAAWSPNPSISSLSASPRAHGPIDGYYPGTAAETMSSPSTTVSADSLSHFTELGDFYPINLNHHLGQAETALPFTYTTQAGVPMDQTTDFDFLFPTYGVW